MAKVSFNQGEVLTAAKMNSLADSAVAGKSKSGGLRSADGIDPLRAGMPRLTSDDLYYEATADAEEIDGAGYYTVTAKRINLDGSLEDVVSTFRALGDPSTDPVPVLSGDRCIVRVTADNREVLVPEGASSGAPQLDHAFLPTRTGATEATLTPGYVTDRHGVRRSITTATGWATPFGWAAGVIDFSVDTGNKCYWVQIKYEPTEGSTQGDFLELRWESGASFPDHRAGEGAALGYTINIPVIEFPENTWASMIRRQTNDIIDSPHDKLDLGITHDQQDPDQPWPTPPDYDDIIDAPDTDEPWETAPRWNEIRLANGDTYMSPGTNDEYDLEIGGANAWKTIGVESGGVIRLWAGTMHSLPADIRIGSLAGSGASIALRVGATSAIEIVDDPGTPIAGRTDIKGIIVFEGAVKVKVGETYYTGASGTFKDGTGKTVRVRNGIITNLNET